MPFSGGFQEDSAGNLAGGRGAPAAAAKMAELLGFAAAGPVSRPGQLSWRAMVMSMVLPPVVAQPSVRAMAARGSCQVVTPSATLSGLP